jgi:hypothetical protein
LKRRQFFQLSTLSTLIPLSLNAKNRELSFSRIAKEVFADETHGYGEIPSLLKLSVPKGSTRRVRVKYSLMKDFDNPKERITRVTVLPLDTHYGKAIWSDYGHKDAIVFQKTTVMLPHTGYVAVIALTNKNHYMISYKYTIITDHSCGDKL